MECILHIGTDKTGSTSLQYTLATQRKTLLGQKVLYPITSAVYSKYLVRHAGIRLAFSELKPEQSGIQRVLGLTDEKKINSYQQKFIDEFDQELADNPSIKRVILSDEDLFRSSDLIMIQGLKNFLEQRFEKIHVISYVRDALPYVLSDYSQQIKMGKYRSLDQHLDIFFQRGGLSKRLILWQTVFGSDRVNFIPYHRHSLFNGEVVADFCHKYELNMEIKNKRRRNPSLSPLGITILRSINQFYAPKHRPRWIRNVIEVCFAGGSDQLATSISATHRVKLEQEQNNLIKLTRS